MGRFRDALAAPGLAAIAEIKRRSPSAGDLRPDAEPHGTVELVGVVGLDERVEPELRRRQEKFGRQRVVEVAQEQQHGVRTGGAQLSELGARRDEALRQQGQLRGRAGRNEIGG